MTIYETKISKIDQNSRTFAIFLILVEVFFCIMYAIYGHTTSYNHFASGGIYQYLTAVGIAIATVIGLGGLMSFVYGLKWSGYGFAFLILAMSFQYYFLISAFWTKADIQATTTSATGNQLPSEDHGVDFMMYISESGASVIKTLGSTATGAFKLALTLCVAFAAVIGRAGPLQILFFVIVGGFLYELNRQIISTLMYDVGGSMTIFMFGGIVGSIVSFVLSFTRQKDQIQNRKNYTSSKFNITTSLMSSGFFWVFFPTIFLDLPYSINEYPFVSNNAMINTYYAISTTVVTSLAFSAIIHGRIGVKDIMYAPFAGAAIVASSAVHIINPISAIILGIMAGLLQPVLNMIEQWMARGKAYFSTCVPFVFATQGFLGALAAGVLKDVRDGSKVSSIFSYNNYPFPFRWGDVGQFYRATFITFGIAIGAGVVIALLVFCVSEQEQHDFYQDTAYWIVNDDGIRKRHTPVQNVQKQYHSEDQIKGVHSYL